MPKSRHAINDRLDDVLSGQQSDEVDGLQALLSLPMSPAKSPTRSPPLRPTPGGAGLVGSPSPLRHMLFKSPASALKQSPIEVRGRAQLRPLAPAAHFYATAVLQL